MYNEIKKQLELHKKVYKEQKKELLKKLKEEKKSSPGFFERRAIKLNEMLERDIREMREKRENPEVYSQKKVLENIEKIIDKYEKATKEGKKLSSYKLNFLSKMTESLAKIIKSEELQERFANLIVRVGMIVGNEATKSLGSPTTVEKLPGIEALEKLITQLEEACLKQEKVEGNKNVN